MSQAQKVTYTTTAPSPELRAAFDAALERVRNGFGTRFSCSIAGQPSATGTLREVRSPVDRRLLIAVIEQSDRAEAERAVATLGPHYLLKFLRGDLARRPAP